MFPDPDPRALRRGQYASDAGLADRLALHQRFSTASESLQSWVGARVFDARPARLLDIGCGPGAMWTELAARFPAASRALLLDFSSGMLARARSRLAGDARFAFVCADARALPLPDASCDTALAGHMLYHLPEPAVALAELRRVLRPGGTLLASTNGRRSMAAVYALLERIAPQLGRSDHADRFGLESGPPQVAEHFRDVETLRFDNELRVTDAEALLRYVTSTPGGAGLDADQRASLRGEVASLIEREGAFRIEIDTGLIRAVRP